MVGSWRPPFSEVRDLATHGQAVRSFANGEARCSDSSKARRGSWRGRCEVPGEAAPQQPNPCVHASNRLKLIVGQFGGRGSRVPFFLATRAGCNCMPGAGVPHRRRRVCPQARKGSGNCLPRLPGDPHAGARGHLSGIGLHAAPAELVRFAAFPCGTARHLCSASRLARASIRLTHRCSLRKIVSSAASTATRCGDGATPAWPGPN